MLPCPSFPLPVRNFPFFCIFFPLSGKVVSFSGKSPSPCGSRSSHVEAFPTDRLLQILIALGQAPEALFAGAVADPGAAAEQHLPAPEDPVALGPGRRTGRTGPLPARPGLPATGEEIRSRGLADRSRQTGTQAPGRPEPGERGADGGQQPAGDLPGTVRQSAAARCCYQKGLAQPLLHGASAACWRTWRTNGARSCTSPRNSPPSVSTSWSRNSG